MPNTFINIDYDDMENSHKKLRIAAVKGLDLFLAVFILLYSLFEVINGGMSFTAVWEFSSLAVFSFFAFIVNTSNYNKLSVVNIITALIFFSVLNYLNPKNEALMLLTLMFYLLSTAVWRRFYSFVFGSAFMAVMLCLYFRGVTDSDYASALPFMLGYMFLSYLLIAGTMLFKYVVRDMADSFAEEKKSINAVVVEKDNFIKKYSHNIRTSLSNIVGFVTLLTKEVSEHQKKFLDTIMAMVQNIVGVMELINIQSESGSDNEMSGKKEDCDLEELILSSAEFIGVAVKIKTEEPLPLFHADTVVIRRLFMSVFDFFKRRAFGKNSLNISVNIGKVKIPPVPVKYRFDILVSDMLQFSDDGTPGYINLIEKLVTYLGGNMKCNFGEESSLLYFNICLDEVEGGAARRSHSYGSSFYVSSKVKKLSQANILICEDNPINQKVMMLSLEKYVESVDVAFNGKECLTLVNKKQYDVILMDIQMPVLDGYATTKAIRQMEKSGSEIRHVPIIAVTANSLSGDREQCLNVGMDDYFAKPFHIEKIVNRISEFLIKYPQE